MMDQHRPYAFQAHVLSLQISLVNIFLGLIFHRVLLSGDENLRNASWHKVAGVHKVQLSAG